MTSTCIALDFDFEEASGIGRLGDGKRALWPGAPRLDCEIPVSTCLGRRASLAPAQVDHAGALIERGESPQAIGLRIVDREGSKVSMRWTTHMAAIR